MHSQAIVEFGNAAQLIETPTPTPQGTEILIKIGTCRRLPFRRAHP